MPVFSFVIISTLIENNKKLDIHTAVIAEGESFDSIKETVENAFRVILEDEYPTSKVSSVAFGKPIECSKENLRILTRCARPQREILASSRTQ